MHRPLPMMTTTCLTILIARGQASAPLVMLRRVFRAFPLGQKHQHDQVSPTGPWVPSWESGRMGELPWVTESRALPPHYPCSPALMDGIALPLCPWLSRASNLSSLHFSFHIGIWWILHAPQWRSPYMLSISIALGNVFNDIWWLKARYSHAMIKKLMIKAL